MAFALEATAQGANSVHIEAFKTCERVGNELVELGSAGVIQPVGCQDIMVKPLKQGLHVVGEADRGQLLGPRLCQGGRELLTLLSFRSLLHFGFDGGSFGDARISPFFELVGHFGEVAKGMKDIALARDIRPCERLAGTQPPCAIGQRIVWVQALSA